MNRAGCAGSGSLSAAAAGASPGGEAVRGRCASLGDRATRGGGGCRLAHASAVGDGLRPSRDCAAVLGAQGLVARSRRGRSLLAVRRTAPLMLLGLAVLGDPGHLRASPLPRSRAGSPGRPAPQRLLALRKEDWNALAPASVNIRHAWPLPVLAPEARGFEGGLTLPLATLLAERVPPTASRLGRGVVFDLFSCTRTGCVSCFPWGPTLVVQFS